MLLPQALQEWLPGPLGVLHQRRGRQVGSERVPRPVCRWRTAQPAVSSGHDGQGAAVAYATGVFSSRKIARKLHEDVAFRVLAADNFPAHRTLSDFRAVHLKELSELFVQVVRLAREMGLVKLGTVAIDGTKVKANASRHKAMSYGHMGEGGGRVETTDRGAAQSAKAADDAERNEPELDVPAEIARREARHGDCLKPGAASSSASARPIRRAGAATMTSVARAAVTANRRAGATSATLSARGQGAGELHRSGQPHHEARRRRFRSELQRPDGGRRDRPHHRGGRADQQRQRRRATGGVLQAVRDNVEHRPRQALADTGYRSATFRELDGCGTELVVALGREGKRRLAVRRERNPHTAQMADKLESGRARAPTENGNGSPNRPTAGSRTCWDSGSSACPGLERVKAEWKLVCMALNLRRIGTLVGMTGKAQTCPRCRPPCAPRRRKTT